jgi:NADH dehydrogenase FAD-containing subunit
MGMQSRRNIIIAGGNFAGLTLARALSPRRFLVTVIDPSPDFEWYPNIHEIVSRNKKPGQLRHARRPLLERLGHRFLQDSVTAIDPRQQRIMTAAGQSLPYDDLVLAIGNTGSLDRVEGAREHAIPCKSIADAERLTQQLQRLDALSLPDRPIVLVGANFVGLEFLGEIIRRFHRQWRFRLQVVDVQPVLMPHYHGLDRWLREQCADKNISWHTGRRVAAVHKDSVWLDDGTRLDSRLTLWCGGDLPSVLPADSGLAEHGGYAPVLPTLQSARDPHVWIAGDAAGFPQPLDKQAFHAMGMAGVIARNLQKPVGKPLSRYRPLPVPRLMSFGDQGLLLTPTHALAHPALLAGKEAVYQGNFTRLNLPRSIVGLNGLRESLQDSVSGMTGLLRRSWEARTLTDARLFRAAD